MHLQVSTLHEIVLPHQSYVVCCVLYKVYDSMSYLSHSQFIGFLAIASHFFSAFALVFDYFPSSPPPFISFIANGAQFLSLFFFKGETSNMAVFGRRQ